MMHDSKRWLLFAYALMVCGCAAPRYTMDLDLILEAEGRKNRTQRAYRCTAGAHRGASVAHLENTIDALKEADRDSRYAFIEFDVQYSRDMRIVVFHDKRMLRVFGNVRTIGDSTFSELQDASGGEIVAYEDIMPVLSKPLNIEIKATKDSELDRRLVDEVAADLRSRKRIDEVLISSISSDVVAYVNARYPDIPTGQIFWLTSSTYLHLDSLTRRLYDEIRATEADYLMLHVANLRNIDDLLRLKPRGKTIVFWDFDDTMYIVHKDLSDRLWIDSCFRSFWQSVRYKLSSLLHRRSRR
jgi:glycerophosphoryl diester phosphodiesterase